MSGHVWPCRDRLPEDRCEICKRRARQGREIPVPEPEAAKPGVCTHRGCDRPRAPELGGWRDRGEDGREHDGALCREHWAAYQPDPKFVLREDRSIDWEATAGRTPTEGRGL